MVPACNAAATCGWAAGNTSPPNVRRDAVPCPTLTNSTARPICPPRDAAINRPAEANPFVRARFPSRPPTGDRLATSAASTAPSASARRVNAPTAPTTASSPASEN